MCPGYCIKSVYFGFLLSEELRRQPKFRTNVLYLDRGFIYY